MVQRTKYSAQTLAVLAALCAAPSDWRRGYDLAKDTGLKSGTLYPILVRLADRGLVEARWEAEQPVGRPRRHLYRLTADGRAVAEWVLAEARRPVGKPRPAPTRRGLAAEGA